MKNYTTHLTDEQFLAWLAGFIDGEGCIYVAKCKNEKISWGFQYSLHVEITQANEDLLGEIKTRIGFGQKVRNKSHLRKEKPESWAEVYALKWSSNQAYEILQKVFPYLALKKKQAELALEFQNLVRGNYGKKVNREASYSHRQEELRNQIRSEKKLLLVMQAP